MSFLIASHAQVALPSRADREQRLTAAPSAAAGSARLIPIARDEHATCRPHSAVALPSQTGGGQRRKAASGAAAGVLRSRETSRPRAICAPQLLSLATLAEGSSARQQRVPPLMQCDRARPARPVPSALCSRSPQLSWLRAAPHGSIGCRRRRAAITQDDPVTRRPHSAAALPSSAGVGPCR